MSNTFKFSSRSEKKLQGGNPDLVKVTRRALEISEVDLGITEGLRSRYRQKQLVATGKRAIELLEQRRLQRLNNEDNNHAEN